MTTQTLSQVPASVPPGRLARARANPWTLPIILTGTFMVVLDFFIVNVALPSMQTHVRASSSALEWVAAGYGLTRRSS